MNPLPLLFAALFAALPACQQTPPPAEQDPAKLMQEMLKQFEAEGVRYDGKAQTVTITAIVNDPQDPLEYLLIHRRGKRHEAMFWTKSKPSVLNAALLLAGFTPGQNAKAEEIVPPPSIEEIEKGAETVKITPPKGAQVWMTVAWKTPEGKEVAYCVEDLLLDLSTQQAVVDASWVYLGGRLARFYKNDPEVFAADMEGNLISTCYMFPDNHLVTISHPLARDQHNWWLTKLVPPPETEVQLTFHSKEPKLQQERRERLAKEAKEKGAATPSQAPDGKDRPATPPGNPEKRQGGGK